MIDSSKWNYSFNLTYSVTLSQDNLETSLVVRNTGSSNYDFQVLFHSYFAIDVSTTCPLLSSKASVNSFPNRTYPRPQSLDSKTHLSSTRLKGQRRSNRQKSPCRLVRRQTESTKLPRRSPSSLPRTVPSDMKSCVTCSMTSSSGILG